MKITFKNDETLNLALTEPVKINFRRYFVEVFTPKPKVIKCNLCQLFGHVTKWCRNQKNPKCGKCSEKHETKTCTVEEQNYKCAHCSQNHITGSYSCDKMKEKMDQLALRRNV